MRSSVHPADPPARRPAVRQSWSLRLPAVPRGMTIAREAGWLLAWDASDSLHLVNRGGQLQGRKAIEGKLVAACAADDGSACAAVGQDGEVWWLTPDLMPRWTAKLPARTTACALDSFGRLLSVADTGGGLSIFDSRGTLTGHTQTPRPLVHVAFVPEEPLIVGCADFGFVGCFETTGKCAWRDGLVAHVGGLAVRGDGSRITLACFSDGIRSYALDGQTLPRWQVDEPCRLVAVSYDGRRTFVGGLASTVTRLNEDGQVTGAHALDAVPTALAVSALGDTLFAAQADGRLSVVPLP